MWLSGLLQRHTTRQVCQTIKDAVTCVRRLISIVSTLPSKHSSSKSIDAFHLLTCNLTYLHGCDVECEEPRVVQRPLTMSTTFFWEQRRSPPTSDQCQHLSSHPSLPIPRDPLLAIRNFARLHEQALSVGSHAQVHQPDHGRRHFNRVFDWDAQATHTFRPARE